MKSPVCIYLHFSTYNIMVKPPYVQDTSDTTDTERANGSYTRFTQGDSCQEFVVEIVWGEPEPEAWWRQHNIGED